MVSHLSPVYRKKQEAIEPELPAAIKK